MTPQESLDGIIKAMRCGICPESKMRDNPCRHCVGTYAAIERVRVLFKAADSVCAWSFEHLLVDHPDSQDVVNDVRLLERALCGERKAEPHRKKVRP